MMTAIETSNLRKRYVVPGKTQGIFEAVCGVSISVKKGEVFGFLGPNGAGKTTIMRMLTTLLPIDEGEAQVAGCDVRREPGKVRRHIGYVSQLGGADLSATGTENLVLEGQLYGMSRIEARKRAGELARILDLSELLERRVKTYSGGQRRRLEVALGIMHRPEVLFLDEPSTGLDPQNRSNLWSQIRKFRDLGMTVFLTTHYLEEADELADRIAIVDHGRIVAHGTPRELKQEIAGDLIILRLCRHGEELQKAELQILVELLCGQAFVREVKVDGESLKLVAEDGTKALPRIFDLLETKNVAIDSVSLAQPSLDDVFLKQTGRSLRDIKFGEVEKP